MVSPEFAYILPVSLGIIVFLAGFIVGILATRRGLKLPFQRKKPERVAVSGRIQALVDTLYAEEQEAIEILKKKKLFKHVKNNKLKDICPLCNNKIDSDTGYPLFSVDQTVHKECLKKLGFERWPGW